MSSQKRKHIKILIVDDHQVVRMGLRTILSRVPHFEVVGETGTGKEALEEIAKLAPDVVLLDVRLPDQSGLEVCRRLRRTDSPTRVLILTSYADERTVLEAITAGADGYLLKEIDNDQLAHSIETVAEGQSVLDPAVTRPLLGLLKGKSSNTPASQLERLSDQEQRVLALVAQGKTNKEIASELGLSDKTVKNYFSNVLDKLHLTRRSQAAAFFVQHQPA